MEADYSGKKSFVSRQIMRAQIGSTSPDNHLTFLEICPATHCIDFTCRSNRSNQVLVCCEHAERDGPHRRSGI